VFEIKCKFKKSTQNGQIEFVQFRFDAIKVKPSKEVTHDWNRRGIHFLQSFTTTTNIVLEKKKVLLTVISCDNFHLYLTAVSPLKNGLSSVLSKSSCDG
jgi:hypothetical protein